MISWGIPQELQTQVFTWLSPHPPPQFQGSILEITVWPLARLQSIGSHDWAYSRCKTNKLQGLSPHTSKQAKMDEFIQENLQSGCIHLSKSLMASPVFFIKKKDGFLWLHHQLSQNWWLHYQLPLRAHANSHWRDVKVSLGAAEYFNFLSGADRMLQHEMDVGENV